MSQLLQCKGCGCAHESRDGRKKYCSVRCRSLARYRRRSLKKSYINQVCLNCSLAFCNLPGNYKKTCSDACAKELRHASDKRSVMKRKAKLRGAEKFTYLEIFVRDGWRCKHCNCNTPAKLRGTTRPNAPEIDHIVPLSRGGKHERRNVQLLCKACNSEKSNGALADQTLLFG